MSKGIEIAARLARESDDEFELGREAAVVIRDLVDTCRAMDDLLASYRIGRGAGGAVAARSIDVIRTNRHLFDRTQEGSS